MRYRMDGKVLWTRMATHTSSSATRIITLNDVINRSHTAKTTTWVDPRTDRPAARSQFCRELTEQIRGVITWCCINFITCDINIMNTCRIDVVLYFITHSIGRFADEAGIPGAGEHVPAQTHPTSLMWTGHHITSHHITSHHML